jgi:hypothetical protein
MKVYTDTEGNVRIEHETTAEQVELMCLVQDYRDIGAEVSRVDGKTKSPVIPGILLGVYTFRQLSR